LTIQRATGIPNRASGQVGNPLNAPSIFHDSALRLRTGEDSPILPPVEARKELWLLKLYVSGKGWLSERARSNLERLCREHIPERYRIDVIDLALHPGAAREHEIVAVPTVVRETPVPIRKMCGDFSDAERALYALQFARLR
jgi:circadian clock protein KaiB